MTAKTPKKTDKPYAGPRRTWAVDKEELYAWELDVVFRMIGCEKPEDFDENGFAASAACAVVLARRDDPSIPLEAWRTIRLADIEMVSHGEDDADPTGPSSLPARPSPKRSGAARRR